MCSSDLQRRASGAQYIGGVDDSSAQQLYARHVYSWRDIRWQHRYRNITSVSPQGRVLLDYTKFHELGAEE